MVITAPVMVSLPLSLQHRGKDQDCWSDINISSVKPGGVILFSAVWCSVPGDCQKVMWKLFSPHYQQITFY